MTVGGQFDASAALLPRKDSPVSIE